MSENFEMKKPSKKDLLDMVEKNELFSIPEKGELVKKIEDEEDSEKIFGELVNVTETKGITLCCWWVCDGASGGQCNCSCEMTQCGCGDIQEFPGICMAGQQGPSSGR